MPIDAQSDASRLSCSSCCLQFLEDKYAVRFSGFLILNSSLHPRCGDEEILARWDYGRAFLAHQAEGSASQARES